MQAFDAVGAWSPDKAVGGPLPITADGKGLLPPNLIVAVIRANERMGYFMQDRVLYLFDWIEFGDFPAEADGPGRELGLPKPPLGVVKGHVPFGEVVLRQKVIR